MDDYLRVVIAALTHDLGKCWQRTGQRHSANYDRFEEEDYGRHGAHAKWSADFIERFLPDRWRRAAVGALFHHNAADYPTKLVAAADWLSSGEREDTDIRQGVQASQLVSIFSRITLSGAEPPHRYYPLRPLLMSKEAIFPQPYLLSDAQRRQAYLQLWESFVSEVKRIPEGDDWTHFETFYYLLQKYTWCVPSAFYGSVPDVSLFDHLRTTCAIAAALYRNGTDEADLDALLRREDAAWRAERVMLVGGDITGVQSFLYTITSKGAARGLRGRSFYLQLIGEAIARWVLRRLDLPISNLVYVGGGRFYLLSHLLRPAYLSELRRDLGRLLLRCHQGDLYVALGAVPLSGYDLRLGSNGRGFGDVWAALAHELNEQKRRKFGELAPGEMYSEVFRPQEKGGEEPPCSVCRREREFEALPPVEAAPEERKCTLCASFEDLGAELRTAEYLYLGRTDPEPPAGPARTYRDTLRAFGLELRLFSSATQLLASSHQLGPGTLFTLRTTDFLAGPSRQVAVHAQGGLALGFYLLANVTPRQDDQVADFESLAKASQGVHRLGVLRMDVDDLGTVFSRGLGAAATLSRVANLSFLLRLFFEGWLAELAARRNPGEGGQQDHIYVIYSGGDDLFIVGSWDQVVELAMDVQRDFEEFTGHNPDLHLSGGVVLEDEHFPVHQAAERAGEALERAKSRQERERVVKNAVDFLGHTLGWPEMRLASSHTQELKDLVEKDGVPRALLHTLAGLHRMAEEARTQARRPRPPGQVPYGRWVWLSAYILGRLAERVKGPGGQRIRELRERLVTPEGVRTFGLAARWAELLLRMEERR